MGRRPIATNDQQSELVDALLEDNPNFLEQGGAGTIVEVPVTTTDKPAEGEEATEGEDGKATIKKIRRRYIWGKAFSDEAMVTFKSIDSAKAWVYRNPKAIDEAVKRALERGDEPKKRKTPETDDAVNGDGETDADGKKIKTKAAKIIQPGAGRKSDIPKKRKRSSQWCTLCGHRKDHYELRAAHIGKGRKCGMKYCEFCAKVKVVNATTPEECTGVDCGKIPKCIFSKSPLEKCTHCLNGTSHFGEGKGPVEGTDDKAVEDAATTTPSAAAAAAAAAADDNVEEEISAAAAAAAKAAAASSGETAGEGGEKEKTAEAEKAD